MAGITMDAGALIAVDRCAAHHAGDQRFADDVAQVAAGLADEQALVLGDRVDLVAVSGRPDAPSTG